MIRTTSSAKSAQVITAGTVIETTSEWAFRYARRRRGRSPCKRESMGIATAPKESVACCTGRFESWIRASVKPQRGCSPVTPQQYLLCVVRDIHNEAVQAYRPANRTIDLISEVHRGLPGIHGITIHAATIGVIARLMFWQMSDQYPNPSAAMPIAITVPIAALAMSIFALAVNRRARFIIERCCTARLLNRNAEADATVSQSSRGSL